MNAPQPQHQLSESLAAQMRFINADPATRSALLAAGIFPGSSGKQPVKLEQVEGVFQETMPASVRIWSIEHGIVDVPLYDLPTDLARCFPNHPDAAIALWKEACAISHATIDKMVADIRAMEREAVDALQSMMGDIKDASDGMDRLHEQLERLTSENAELRRQLEAATEGTQFSD